MKAKIILFSITMIAICSFSGCTKVTPWQKGNLAKPHMAFDPDPLDRKFTQHIYDSKEGVSGGASLAGSGCGCN